MKLFQLPDNDISRYLVGLWKRNLEWRDFGGNFSHLRTTNTVVSIESHAVSSSESGVKYLKWSFGKSFHKSDLEFGFLMKCTMRGGLPLQTYLGSYIFFRLTTSSPLQLFVLIAFHTDFEYLLHFSVMFRCAGLIFRVGNRKPSLLWEFL
jgi:hypothetical protein